MRVDVLALQRFYGGPLGALAQRMAGRRIEAAWPPAQLAGLDVLGLGYAGPHLAGACGQARRVVLAMPGAQGAERWPAVGPGAAALVEETRLPFADAVFDRVLLAHVLEEAQAAGPLLREVWRVTAPEGRVIVLATNRVGLWALADHTPFGHGRPYSRAQLAAALDGAMFEPMASTRCLYAPPWGAALPLAEAFERAGERLWPPFGGLVLMEARKRLMSATTRQGRGVLIAAPARAGGT